MAVSLFLAGCATRVPAPLRDIPSPQVSVAQVRQDAEKFIGTRVRWGGSIAVVENRPSETLIEIVSQPLDRDGRPQLTRATGGRFLAKLPDFLDPLIYGERREITVVGTLRGQVTRKIGHYEYTFPVVAVDSHYLWERVTYPSLAPIDWWRYDCWPYPYSRYAWPFGPYYW